MFHDRENASTLKKIYLTHAPTLFHCRSYDFLASECAQPIAFSLATAFRVSSSRESFLS